ncbi:MAG: peptidylprolyl isomerase [Woeseiaceae bacterium]|nr:peptidylprolyl isomerase [Woeseiaceae bacterium]
MKISQLIAVSALVAAPLPALADLSETGEFLDGVAAVVNEGVVMRSQLTEETANIIRSAQAQNIPLPPADILREQVLERLIVKEIQLQRAERIGLSVSDQILNNVISEIAGEQGITLADMPQFLAAQGVNYQDFRNSLREDVTLEQLRRIDVGQRINVSRRELEQCLIDLETNVVANSQYNLSHILVPLPNAATAAQIEDVRVAVEAVYDRITEGADFREMAIQYSRGQTALQGGSLGWLPGEQVPSIFTDVLAPMRKGDVSEPFRTTGAYHIIKVDDMKSAVERSTIDQVKARHILVTPNEIIDEQTARQKVTDALEDIREGADFAEVARLTSDDPSTAPLGGDLGWTGPGTFVPEFEAMLNSLEIGEISEPFKTPFGWHIVQLVDTRVYDNTEDLKEQNCGIRIRNGKLEDEIQLWIRRLRDEAFVDVKI